jgi:Xaa-Pro aminopeptidase
VAAAHLDRRVDAARAHLRALDADALLVTHLPNITWLSGFTGSAAVLLLTPAASAH